MEKWIYSICWNQKFTILDVLNVKLQIRCSMSKCLNRAIMFKRDTFDCTCTCIYTSFFCLVTKEIDFQCILKRRKIESTRLNNGPFYIQFMKFRALEHHLKPLPATSMAHVLYYLRSSAMKSAHRIAYSIMFFFSSINSINFTQQYWNVVPNISQ